MKEAGCYEEFRECGRGGEASVHAIWDHLGREAFAFGHGDDSPEIDREQIKSVLLGVIPEKKVRWEMGVRGAERGEGGEVVLRFEDGSVERGFKLVVGADGAWSRIRHLVYPFFE